MCVCVSVTAAAAEPDLLVDLKDQASLFFKLLLKNRRGVLYNPFSEKTLLIPVGRSIRECGYTTQTSCLLPLSYAFCGGPGIALLCLNFYFLLSNKLSE